MGSHWVWSQIGWSPTMVGSHIGLGPILNEFHIGWVSTLMGSHIGWVSTLGGFYVEWVSTLGGFPQWVGSHIGWGPTLVGVPCWVGQCGQASFQKWLTKLNQSHHSICKIHMLNWAAKTFIFKTTQEKKYEFFACYGLHWTRSFFVTSWQFYPNKVANNNDDNNEQDIMSLNFHIIAGVL